MYAKLFIPTLEARADVPASDDLTERKRELSLVQATSRNMPVERVAPPRISSQDWRKTQCKAQGWREIGFSDFLYRAIKFGVIDEPIRSFIPGQGVELSGLPRTEEYLTFAFKDIEEGCRTDIYQEVNHAHVDRAIALGAILSSAFTVWQDSGEKKKGRFVVNLSKQSKHWNKGSVRMESVSEFALSLQEGDHLLTMDIENGYRHL